MCIRDRDEIQLEEQKLEAAKKNTIEFIARVSAVYQAQAKALVELAKGEKLVRPQPASAEQASEKAPQAAAAPSSAEAAPLEKADAPIADATRKFDFGEDVYKRQGHRLQRAFGISGGSTVARGMRCTPQAAQPKLCKTAAYLVKKR